jgi:hypothetical protein
MRLSKIFTIASFITIVIAVLVLNYFKDDTNINLINESKVTRIQIQQGIDGVSIAIDDKSEIERIMNKLNSNNWKSVECKYQSYPEQYVLIYNNQGVTEMGFFLVDNNAYCKVIRGKKSKCYKVPLDSFESIKKYK